MTRAFRSRRSRSVVAMATVALAGLMAACGGGTETASGSAGDGSICALRTQASQAVLRGQGTYAGRESKLAADFRKASIPKSANSDDTAELKRLRSEAANAIEAVGKAKANSDAAEDARAEVESLLGDIAANGACADADGGTATPAAPATTVAPCPNKSVVMSATTAWSKVKDAYETDEWAATATFTNPNPVPVIISNSTAVIEYTGGRIRSALTGTFAALPAPEGSSAFRPLVGPNQTVKVTLSAVAGQGVTAITTTQAYVSGSFVFGDQNCPVVVEGAKPYKDAPQVQRHVAAEAGKLPECGAQSGALLCA